MQSVSVLRLILLTSADQILRIVSIEELTHYRLVHDMLVEELASAPLPIDELGDFTIKVFGNLFNSHLS